MTDLTRFMPHGVAILGSAIGHDWLGAGAGLFALLRDATVKDRDSWRTQLAQLAGHGWDSAAAERNKQPQTYPEPDREACIAYVLHAVDTGNPPTPEGLMAFPGSSLDDSLETSACHRAAVIFLQRIIEAMLVDRTFAVFSVMIAHLQSLATADARRDAQIAALRAALDTAHTDTTKLDAVMTAFDLLSSPALRPYDRQLRRRDPDSESHGPLDYLLDYLSDAVEFCGRDAEVDSLIDFCQAPAPTWRWQALTGPGGSGKSRLALEVCRRLHADNWTAYFLDDSAFNTPPPTALADCATDILFVIDYVAFAADRIGRWLAALPSSPAHRIRVLLIEREGWNTESIDYGKPMWFEALAKHLHADDLRQHLGKVDMSRPVLSLANRPALDAASMVRIVLSIGASTLSESAQAKAPAARTDQAAPVGLDAETAAVVASSRAKRPKRRTGAIPTTIARDLVAHLREQIDPASMRPLYLLFLAQAYLGAPGDSTWRTWDIHQLHNVIYEREKLRLEKQLPEKTAGVALDLWAFATATRTPLADALAEGPTWLAEDVVPPRGPFQHNVRRCIGSSAAEITPYTPDIPGEYLVIARLYEWTNAARVRRFAAECWNTAPEEFTDFLARLLSDLGDKMPTELTDLLTQDTLLATPPSVEKLHNLAAALAASITSPNQHERTVRLLLDWANQNRDDDVLTSLAVRSIIATTSISDSSQAGSFRNVSTFAQFLQPALPDVNDTEMTDLAPLMYETLQTCVGELLGVGLSDDAINEFDTLERSGDEQAMMAWLTSYRPNYADTAARIAITLKCIIGSIHELLPWVPLTTASGLLADHIGWNPIFSADERDCMLASRLADQTAKSDIDADETRQIITELRDLTLRLAMGLVNLTWKPEVNADETRHLITELRDLTNHHSTNPNITLQLAMGLINLTGKPDVNPGESRILVKELAGILGNVSVEDPQTWLLTMLDNCFNDEQDGTTLRLARDAAQEEFGDEDALSRTLKRAYDNWKLRRSGKP